MTQQTQNKPQKSIKQVLNQGYVQERFKKMLGDKAIGFLVSVMNVVQGNTDLSQADHNSVLYAAATAASLDLPIDPNLGFAYIVPYKDKKKGVTQAQFQMGYKGFIQLAQRSGQFKTISTTPIYEGQIIEANPLTGYKFDFTETDSDKVIGYAAYFSLVSGFEKTLYMSVDEIKKHASAYSKTYKSQYGQWSQNFDGMAMKTVLKLLLSKYAPLSVDMQQAVKTDQAVVNDYEGNQIEYPDNKQDPHEEAIENQENAQELNLSEPEKEETKSE